MHCHNVENKGSEETSKDRENCKMCRMWERMTGFRSEVKDKRKGGRMVDNHGEAWIVREGIQSKRTEKKNCGSRQGMEQLKHHPGSWREKLNQKENLLNFLQNGCQEESFLEEYLKCKCEGGNLLQLPTYNKDVWDFCLALIHRRIKELFSKSSFLCLWVLSRMVLWLPLLCLYVIGLVDSLLIYRARYFESHTWHPIRYKCTAIHR